MRASAARPQPIETQSNQSDAHSLHRDGDMPATVNELAQVWMKLIAPIPRPTLGKDSKPHLPIDALTKTKDREPSKYGEQYKEFAVFVKPERYKKPRKMPVFCE